MGLAALDIQDHVEIALNIEPFPVDGQNAVPRLEAVVLRQGAVGFDLGDFRHHELLGRAEHDGVKHQPRQEVHEGPRRQNQEPLPPLGLAEGTGIVAVLVLALHGAVAADRDAADSI